MSIKSSQASLRMKPLLFAMLGLTAAAGGVRTYQMLHQIDASTGFFLNNGVFQRVFLYAIPVLGVLWLIVSYLSKDAGSRSPDRMQSKVLAGAAVLMSAGLVADCVQAIRQIRSLGQVTVEDGSSMFATGKFALIGEAVFAALAAVYLLLLAASYFGKEMQRLLQNNGIRLLALSPMLWAASRMVHHFLIKISFSRVSDLFFELIMLGFMTLFFLYFAQLNSNVYRVGFEWRVFGFGAAAALVAGMLSLSRIIVLCVSRSAVNADYPVRPADCVFCVFVFVLLFVLLRQPQEVETVPAAGEETKAD